MVRRFKCVRAVLVCFFGVMILLFARSIRARGGCDGKMLLLVGALQFVTNLAWWKKERRQKQEYQKLSCYVHRIREILPAFGRALQSLEQEKLSEETRAVFLEIAVLYEEELRLRKAETRECKVFRPTGCRLLDMQFTAFLEECENDGVDLDVYVATGVSVLMKDYKITIREITRLVGDLYRNAMNAVNVTSVAEKRILFCFGVTQHKQFEIAVYDSGISFPARVIRKLGKRGISKTGTGNGMADIFQILEKYEASFILCQHLSGIYTKAIQIHFDGQKRKIVQ